MQATAFKNQKDLQYYHFKFFKSFEMESLFKANYLKNSFNQIAIYLNT